MGSDSKLLPIPLGAGMDQSADEFAVAQPGNIRRAINARSRRGGSVEQRRGVHGFAATVPTYMIEYQATGVVEFADGLDNSAYIGMRGRAFSVDREGHRAFFAGHYSQYVPLGRSSAFLTEETQGVYGHRHAAIGYDNNGREYTVLASHGEQFIDCRVIDDHGKTIATFQIDLPDAGVSSSRGLTLSGTVIPYVAVAYISGSRLRVAQIELGSTPKLTVPSSGLTGLRASATPVPSGAFTSTAIGDIQFVASVASINVGTIWWLAHNPAQGATVTFTSSVPSGTTGYMLPALAQSRAPAGYVLMAYTNRTSNLVPTGSVNYLLIHATDTGANSKIVATGTLVDYESPGYSAPVVSSTEDPNTFIWAVSNGHTKFGKLTVASGGPQVTQDADVRGVPLSHFDSHGAIWMMEDTAEYAPVPRGSRALLVKYPDPLTQGSGIQRPYVQLSAPRQLGSVDSLRVWDRNQVQYSQIAEGKNSTKVVLPLQLRSQETGLYSLELYEYQSSSQSQSRMIAQLGKSLVVSGQPVEIYQNPNRSGGHVTGTVATGRAKPDMASEVGFPAEPYISTLSSVSGANITPGSRLYTALIEWLAPSGERHRSRPATPRSIVNTSPVGIHPTVPEEFLSQRYPTPRIHYYRTVAGQKQFLRVSPDTGVEPGATFIDHVTDEALRDNEVLYTDGGVQPNDLAPSCRFMARGENRLWLGGLFESDIIQCSKVFVPREPVQFSDHDAFKVRLPFPCTGLAYLDGSLVAFCQNSSYLISGDGPNNQGAGGFSLRPIADNVGCIDHRSIVETSEGIFFQSKRGIQLMPRGFGPPTQFRNLNELMGEFGDGFTEVIGATTREYTDEETVRFLLRNPQTNKRIVATLELGTQTWNYDVIRDENGDEQPLSAIGDGPEGVLYGAGSGTYRIMTELEGVGGTPYDSMGSTVDRFWSEVHLGKFQPFGPAGEGKLKAVQLRGYAPSTGAQVNMSVVRDYSTRTHIYSGLGTGGTFFRRATAGEEDQSASEAQVTAVFRAGVGRAAGLRLLSLTLELEPTSGARRARLGEQD